MPENKTKLFSLKLYRWFYDGLKKAQEPTETRAKRSAAQIIMEAVCKVEKIKIPKGFKFRVFK